MMPVFLITAKGIYSRVHKQGNTEFISYDEIGNLVSIEKNGRLWYLNKRIALRISDANSVGNLVTLVEKMIEIHGAKKVIKNVDKDSVCHNCKKSIVANTLYCPQCGKRVFLLEKI